MSAPEHPVGVCPHWCELPNGHEWEDVWREGPVRFHTWTRLIISPAGRCADELRIEESEQHHTQGVARRLSIVLDVEAPTEWDLPTAQHAYALLGHAISLATSESPQGPRR